MKITDKNHKVYSSYPILLELLDDLSFKNNSYCTILNYISGIYRFLEFINADSNNLDALEEGDISCYMHPVDAFMRPNEKSIIDKIMGGEFHG